MSTSSESSDDYNEDSDPFDDSVTTDSDDSSAFSKSKNKTKKRLESEISTASKNIEKMSISQSYDKISSQPNDKISSQSSEKIKKLYENQDLGIFLNIYVYRFL